MTTREAALALGVSEQRIRQRIRAGSLRAYGKRSPAGHVRDWWIRPADVEALRGRNKAGRPKKARVMDPAHFAEPCSAEQSGLGAFPSAPEKPTA